MAEPYEGYSYCTYPSSVNFEVDFVQDAIPQDTPIEGKPASSMVSNIPAGSKCIVNGVALDAKGNEWWRVSVNDSLVWVSKDSGSMKITDATKGSYDAMTTSFDYKRCKNTAASLEYQNQIKKKYETREETGVNLNVEFNGVELVTRIITNDMSFWQLDTYLSRMKNVFGLPPQWNPYTDPIVTYGQISLGRRYSQVIMANPTIIALSPGVIKYSSALTDSLANVGDWSNTDSLKNTFTNGDIDMLWKFEERWGIENDSYLNYVNAICKYAIECMSSTENGYLSQYPNDATAGEILKKRPMPAVFGVMGDDGELGTYKDFNIEWLLGSNRVDTGDVLMAETNDGFWKTFTNLGINYLRGNIDDTIPNTLKDILSTTAHAIDNLNKPHFVYFAVNGQVSAREQFNTETRSSIIETFISGAMNDTVKDIAFITTGVVNSDVAEGDIEQIKSLALSEFGSGLGNILASAMDMIKGGNMTFPQMIGDVSWGREYTFSVKFTTVYGDVESRFLNVIMPYICLMCLWLPRQMHTPMDMYAYPFIVQAYANGLFACPAGVLTGIEVSRGGSEETGWTGGGQPMEIDVNFSIKPLHVKLMMSGDSLWFLKNVGLQNYMGTICGVDLTMTQKELINNTAKMFFDDTFSLEKIAARVESSIAAKITNNTFFKRAKYIYDTITGQ